MLSGAKSTEFTEFNETKQALLVLIDIVQKPDAMTYILKHRAQFWHYFEDVNLLNRHDDSGHTLLHYAASEGSFEMVEFLVRKGADINVLNNEDETPFMLGVLNCFDGNAQTLVHWISFFLSAGAEVACEDVDGKTVTEHVFDILEAKINFLNPEALGAWLSGFSIEPIIDLALKTPRAVLDKATQENQNQSPGSFFCSVMRRLASTKTLLEDKAFQRAVSRLYFAVAPVEITNRKEFFLNKDLIKLRRYLQDYPEKKFSVDKDGNDLLMLAVMSCHDSAVFYLVKQGFSLKVFNKQGQSALMLSILFKRENILNYFLNIATKEDLTAFNIKGKTALSTASDSLDLATMSKISRALFSKFEGSRFFYLIYSGTPEALFRYIKEALNNHINSFEISVSKVEYAAAVSEFNAFRRKENLPVHLMDERDAEGKTALHHLVSLGAYCEIRKQFPLGLFGNHAHAIGMVGGVMLSRYFKIMDILMSFNCDLYACDYRGNTALMVSAGTPNYVVTSDLLGRGLVSQINAVNNEGETALMIAAHHGFSETVNLLMQSGADATKKNKNGETALDLARSKNRRAVIAQLSVEVSKTYHERDEGFVSGSKRVKYG